MPAMPVAGSSPTEGAALMTVLAPVSMVAEMVLAAMPSRSIAAVVPVTAA